jgi:hypothetical protein
METTSACEQHDTAVPAASCLHHSQRHEEDVDHTNVHDLDGLAPNYQEGIASSVGLELLAVARAAGT